MEISLKPYADTITLKDILYQIALFRFNMTMGLCGGMGWDGYQKSDEVDHWWSLHDLA